MTRLCVYCGSGSGRDERYLRHARELGEAMASGGFDLVYGGASIGLMGHIADSVIASGREVHGVMPQSLADKEIAHPGLTALHITSSMHERKALMADLSDGFIAMPGGLGTLEELFETWTWSQLGFHRKPVALFNPDGFFDGLIGFLDHATTEGFIKQDHRDSLIVAEDPGHLLALVSAYQPTFTDKLSSQDAP